MLIVLVSGTHGLRPPHAARRRSRRGRGYPRSHVEDPAPSARDPVQLTRLPCRRSRASTGCSVARRSSRTSTRSASTRTSSRRSSPRSSRASSSTCGPRRPTLRRPRTLIHVELPPPTSAQRAQLWRATLAEISADDADHLAGSTALAPAVIHQAAAVAAPARRATGDRALAADDLVARHSRRPRRSPRRSRAPRHRHADLGRPRAPRRAARRRSSSSPRACASAAASSETLGLRARRSARASAPALFSGPPGTGKTMVAALIARDLGLELYQVDMAQLTSKYIGETEKHLSDLFDAAEAGHAVLLFDEADSLFGKRTEVRSSNDRYANLETNYLLQRLEAFTGTAILTSNHEANIDPAFLRRLALHVRFDVPDEAERAQLWRAMLPAAAPLAADLDLAGLARRYEMSSGYIPQPPVALQSNPRQDGARPRRPTRVPQGRDLQAPRLGGVSRHRALAASARDLAPDRDRRGPARTLGVAVAVGSRRGALCPARRQPRCRRVLRRGSPRARAGHAIAVGR